MMSCLWAAMVASTAHLPESFADQILSLPSAPELTATVLEPSASTNATWVTFLVCPLRVARTFFSARS